MAAPTSSDGVGHLAVRVSPARSADRDALNEVVQPDALVPSTERQEILDLRKRGWKRGWKRPAGLKAYSLNAMYTDLYVYYDSGNTHGAINELALRAFSCYASIPRIHGDVVIVRAEPPMHMDGSSWAGLHFSRTKAVQYYFPYSPLIPLSEMVDTLIFFSTHCCRTIAQGRDFARVMGTTPSPEFMPPSTPPVPPTPPPVGGGAGRRRRAHRHHRKRRPASSAPPTTRESPSVTISACGACGATTPRMRCANCLVANYCDSKCQHAHWATHKPSCVSVRKSDNSKGE